MYKIRGGRDKMLKGKNIALYVSGGIATYKVANLARSFIKRGANVRVGMTAAAKQFVTPYTFQVLTKHHVYTEVFDEVNPQEVAHVELARWADIAIVAPATANIIAKMAHGICDDFVTTALLATPVAKLVIPAMNDQMYEDFTTQDNIASLRLHGVEVMEPAVGFLAEGYEGKGRFPEEEDIIDLTKQLLIKNDKRLPLWGKNIVVTAGGTREAIDPVRFLTNESSGKMGHALAEVAFNLGAKVTLITTSAIRSTKGIKRVDVTTAREMQAEVHATFKQADALVMSAAVSDYRPKESANQKIKKDTQTSNELTIQLTENPDILKSLIPEKENQIVVGFAAETQNLDTYARKKLQEKQLDLLVANDVSKKDRGFNADTNAVTLYSRVKDPINIGVKAKLAIAEDILEQVIELLEERSD